MDVMKSQKLVEELNVLKDMVTSRKLEQKPRQAEVIEIEISDTEEQAEQKEGQVEQAYEQVE